ncbi:MAG: NAD-glutamate dehydrogenase [Methylobacteriaceae bacterium]|nr:NAD-glutamate dehydrogenase [Methylobacteriaceae bacterium]
MNDAAPEPVAPPAFADALFGRTAQEDRAQLRPESLAALARAAWAHLAAPRAPGRGRIRLVDPANEDPGLAAATILEVVNDDMPFLLDSTLAELGEHGLDLRLVAHPILAVRRDAEGRLQSARPPQDDPEAPRESLIHIHVGRIVDAARRARLVEGLDKVYADARVAVADWRAMRERVAQAAAAYKSDPPPLPVDEIAEAVQFLEWLAADNFTFLGLREYRFAESQLKAAAAARAPLDAIGGPGLGILRDPEVKVLRRGAELVTVTPEVMEFLREPHALIIAKANVRSRVHRRAHMDYVGVKLFSKSGALQGELRLVGLFTATAYTRSTQTIPYIRHKVSRVVRQAGFDPASHSGKVLANVLESYPRDELFQVDAATLADFARQTVLLYERPRLRVLARVDRFDRFVSVLCYVPRDRYDTRVRQRVGDYLARVYKGRVSAVYPFYPEGPLVRVHYIIGRDEGETPRIAQSELESAVAAIVTTWPDALREALARRHGDAGRAVAQRYGEAFSAAYRDSFPATDAIDDIAVVDRLTGERARDSVFYRIESDAPEQARLKVFSRGRPMPLSERVPLFEDMGFRVISEDTFEIAPQGDERTWLHDMLLARARPGALDVAALKPQIEAMLDALFRDAIESDGYNALVIEAGLGWRDIAMLRALSRYLRQARIGFSQDYMWRTMAAYPAIARKLVDLFYVRFDPRMFDAMADRETTQAAVVAEIETMLGQVASLDEDRILRRFLNLLLAAVRANYFQTGKDGAPREVISFKFESRRVASLPLPLPLYEISLYSPRVEGVHLRFGKVARGGIRWSDRPQDFRTEVLGLVKAQQVKNAVIVPVGAKGGFVPKRLPPPTNRDAWMAEGIAAYKIFIQSLLDLTDNLDIDVLIAPADTVRHDGDDPYLVVAADKGTATFSDIANALSLEHGHWLGDAFASGGSVGYDHKKMGITARGAWEAVKRHFREMDVDIQTTPFSCVGVGDMSGDVFGNGMLLSKETRLIAAFDHRDIFIDPDPDPGASWAERARLFALPRSSWQDYDKALISAGGGVFPRSAKSIALSEPARRALGLEAPTATPQEVMSAILKADVDLLWFGGIGTYVRAASETDEKAGDRANDAIRITGAQIRARVVGEGANLGMTQLGRVEAAQNGVRLNTDAIDNSAGVNTSDVEVNVKIALSTPVREQRLTEAGRNELLAAMTDDVAQIVLRNNYQQTLALSLAERRGASGNGFARRLMQALERDGRLDRAVEFLPDDHAIADRDRAGRGLTRPELAVLLAYAKLSLYDALLASRVPDDAYLGRELARYFPRALTERFPEAVASHRLRREIVATALSNAIVNRAGPAIVTRIADETGADAAATAYAFAAVRDAFSLTQLNGEIDALDARIAGEAQLELYAAVQQLLHSRMVWFIRNVDFSEGLEAVTRRYRAGVEEIAAALDQLLPQHGALALKKRADQLVARGAPAPLAARVAALDALAAATDVTLVAARSGAPIADVARVFYAVDAEFGLDRLAAQAQTIRIVDHYDRLALDRALDRIAAARRAMTSEAVAAGAGGGREAVAAWLAGRGDDIARLRDQIAELTASGASVSKLVVAAGLIGDLTRG